VLLIFKLNTILRYLRGGGFVKSCFINFVANDTVFINLCFLGSIRIDQRIVTLAHSVVVSCVQLQANTRCTWITDLR